MFQLYHEEKKLQFDDLCFILDQHAELELEFYSSCSLNNIRRVDMSLNSGALG